MAKGVPLWRPPKDNSNFQSFSFPQLENWPFQSITVDPNSRKADFRTFDEAMAWALKNAPGGITIELGPGVHDYRKSWAVSVPVSLRGRGRLLTQLVSSNGSGLLWTAPGTSYIVGLSLITTGGANLIGYAAGAFGSGVVLIPLHSSFYAENNSGTNTYCLYVSNGGALTSYYSDAEGVGGSGDTVGLLNGGSGDVAVYGGSFKGDDYSVSKISTGGISLYDLPRLTGAINGSVSYKFYRDSNENLVAGDDATIGLGASAGRIAFDDQTTDRVNILDAQLGLDAATTPNSSIRMEVNGSMSGNMVALKAYNTNGTANTESTSIQLARSTSHVMGEVLASNLNSGSFGHGFLALLVRISETVTEMVRVNLNGVGIGTTSPRGRLHTYGSIGGFLVWEFDGVTATTATIIPNGTGDVLYQVDIHYIARSSAGGVVSNISTGLTPGTSFNITIGGSTWNVACGADGSVFIRRTAGSDTLKIQMQLMWL